MCPGTLKAALRAAGADVQAQLTPAATPAEIRAAYHRASREFHPDRYAAVESLALRENVARIYRRINEEGTALVKAKCPECGHQFEVDTGGDLGES